MSDLPAENARLRHMLAEEQARVKELQQAIDHQLSIHAAHIREINHAHALSMSSAQQQTAAERLRAETAEAVVRTLRSDRRRAANHETKEIRKTDG